MALRCTALRFYERRLVEALPAENMSRHVGVILDGHRRFALGMIDGEYRASYESGMAKLEEPLGPRDRRR